jgi:WD40 repeat protein
LLLGGRNGDLGQPLEGAKLWNLDTNHLDVSAQAGLGPVAFRRDGKPLHLVAKGERAVLLWSLADQKSLGEVQLDATPTLLGPIALARNELGVPALALSRDGSVAAAATTGCNELGRIAVWDTASSRMLFQFPQQAVTLALSPAGDLLAAGDARGRITVWTVPEGKSAPNFKTGRMSIHCLSFSPDGKRLAVGDFGRAITVWDVQTRLPIAYCQGAHHHVHALAFNPDGTLLASGGDGPAHLWDAATGRLLLSLRSRGVTTALAFAPDGRRLVVGSKSPARVSVWDLEAGRGIQTLRGLTGPAARLCFSGDNQLLAALAPDGQVAIWDVARGELRFVLAGPKGGAEEAALAFSSDGFGWPARLRRERNSGT